MTEASKTIIGHLVDIDGSGMVARLLPMDGDSIETNEGSVLVGQPGSYVVIRQGDLRILAIIGRVYERLDDANQEKPHRYINIKPMGELKGKRNFQRGVKRYPTLGAEIHVVNSREINSIFTDVNQYGFKVGYMSGSVPVPVSLNPSAMFGRHFAILGQSGSGKSWTVTSLLQTAISSMPNAHIIMLDLHGEYCWRDDDGELHSAFDKKVVRYMDARDLEIPYWVMTYNDLVELLIDSDDKNASIQKAFLKDVLQELKEPEAQSVGIGSVSIDSPIYFSIDEVYKRFKEANEEKIEFGKTEGLMFGRFDEFLLKLQSRLNDSRYDFLLKPEKRTDSTSLSGLLRDFVGLGTPKAQITVIDLSSVPFDIRPSISAQVGRLAFEFNLWNPENRRFPILLVCEEAHAYIPREGTGQFEGTRKTMERIAKEGRKYGVGLAVISQRPHELSETVLAQCGTFICLRITNPTDQEYVKKLVPEGEGDVLKMLPGLGRGEALALGEGSPLPVRFQVFKPNPIPHSNDVDYHESWKKGLKDLDVDEIVNRWWRQSRHRRTKVVHAKKLNMKSGTMG
ncbi:MAG: helicase HerA-like domain-containing protein [Methylococcales bacterium]